MILMKGNKSICYVYGKSDLMELNLDFNESEYKYNVITIYFNKNNKFKIIVNWYTIHYTKIVRIF